MCYDLFPGDWKALVKMGTSPALKVQWFYKLRIMLNEKLILIIMNLQQAQFPTATIAQIRTLVCKAWRRIPDTREPSMSFAVIQRC